MIAKKDSGGIVGSRFLAFQAKPETACKPVGNLLLVFHGLSAFEQPRRDIRKGGGNQRKDNLSKGFFNYRINKMGGCDYARKAVAIMREHLTKSLKTLVINAIKSGCDYACITLWNRRVMPMALR